MNENDTVERARTLLEMGRAREAEPMIRRGLAAAPDDSDLHTLLAQSLLGQDRDAEARDAARTALAREPRHVIAMRLLAVAQLRLGSPREAAHTLEGALQHAPGWADLHQHLAGVLLSDDRPHEALPHAEKARELDPEDAASAVVLAGVLHALRRWDDARGEAREALRLDPENVDAHALLGDLSRRSGQSRESVESFRQAVRLDPTDPAYRQMLATAMKARNPLYAVLLRYAEWLQGLPRGVRIGVLVAPFVLSRVLDGLWEQPVARVLFVLLVAVVVLTWVLEPLMNLVLLCSPFARRLLPRSTVLATLAFLAYVAVAVGAVLAWSVTDTTRWLVVAMGLGLWSISAGSAHLVDESRARLVLGLHAGGVLLSVAAVLTTAVGAPISAQLSGLLVLSGALMTWVTTFA